MADNGIGDEGATSLSTALKCCSELRVLFVMGELFWRLSVHVGVLYEMTP